MRALLLFCALVACNNVFLVVIAKTFSGIYTTFHAIQLNGQIYSWGQGGSGQLGHGEFANSAFPVKMLNVQHATDVNAGETHTCIADEGKAKCTGYMDYLGRNSKLNNTNTLVDVEGVDYSVETVEQVFARNGHSCLVTNVGGVKCWGSNLYGQVGNVVAVEYDQAFPVTGFETSGVATMSLGDGHTCLLNTLGKVYCAGDNRFGQLGRGTANTNVNAEMQPIAGEEIMISISSGTYHVCALSNTATVYCWGHAGYGQLGQGNTENRYVPTIVPGLSNIALISCAMVRTFVLLKNGQGAKFFGGSFQTLSPVTTFAGETNIVDIQEGYEVTCIKLTSGAIRCYGLNNYGQLGNGEPSYFYLNLVDVLYLPITSAPTTLPTVSPTQLPTFSPTFPTAAPTALPTSSPTLPTAAPTALPTLSPTLPTAAPTALPTLSPTLPTASPTITAEPDLSLVGLVALAPILAVIGAVAYCKFIKAPTSQSGALQRPSSPV